MENQSVPDMPYFERDQRGRGKDHQKLRPTLLHVNANAFSKKHAAIKKRENSGRAQRAARKRVLLFVEQENDVFAMMQEQLVVRPI